MLLTMAASAAAASRAAAQDAPGPLVRLEAGRASIHGRADGGWIGGLTIAGATDWWRIRYELGVRYSPADEGFGEAHAGLELALLPRSRVTPLLTLRLGLLAEPEYGGWAAGVAVGGRVRLNGDVALRGTLGRGIHGGEEGPHTLMAGLELPLP